MEIDIYVLHGRRALNSKLEEKKPVSPKRMWNLGHASQGTHLVQAQIWGMKPRSYTSLDSKKLTFLILRSFLNSWVGTHFISIADLVWDGEKALHVSEHCLDLHGYENSWHHFRFKKCRINTAEDNKNIQGLTYSAMGKIKQERAEMGSNFQ